ncbi:hypothetical protein [Paenibacillus sp. 32O-W]|uniref:hypothetical protein n=1 Tax=Paenibacillus sp. 32O-W TaxID=1695218 RepID=UPI0011AEBE65|nr:hypothetical protein [Paenibacillus sp. 32O-W]
MEDWGITGYELQEVAHKGPSSGKVPCYLLVPIETLPAWSSKMPRIYFVTEEHCHDCGIQGRITGPFHYDKTDLNNHANDVYFSNEYISNRRWAYRATVISKRFRDLLIENKITRDVRDMHSTKYGSRDWLFDPVIIVE